MKSHFANFLDIEFAASERLARKEIAQDTGAAATQGKALSGRRWLVLEEILIRSLLSFSQRVSAKLDSLDPEHSPVEARDFKLAEDYIRKFRGRCEEIHAEHRGHLNSTYPASRPPFEGGDLDRTEANALNEIQGRLATFVSKRSFLKWALGDLRKRIWSGGLILLGTAIGSILIPAVRELIGA
ncbi:MAG: hypothetical protein IPK75_05460 [Acidobacteria bacterium]|nr:hypothetical protein [Acidobacteriota bacterium]